MSLRPSICFLCLTAFADSVVQNPDGSITATAGTIVCTGTLGQLNGVDSLHQNCVQGAALLNVSDTPASVATLSFSIYTGSGDYVAWTVIQSSPDVWIVTANGKLLQGTFAPAAAAVVPTYGTLQPSPDGSGTMCFADLDAFMDWHSCPVGDGTSTGLCGTLPDLNCVIPPAESEVLLFDSQPGLFDVALGFFG